MIDRFKEVAKCGLSRVGRWAARTASVHSVPQSHGTLRRLEAAVARCGLSLVGRWRIERTASVHSESKTRRVGLRAAPLLRSAAPSPHHTHAHPAAASATPPLLRRTRRTLAHTLSHTSLSRRLSIAPLLPFVAPPLRPAVICLVNFKNRRKLTLTLD